MTQNNGNLSAATEELQQAGTSMPPQETAPAPPGHVPSVVTRATLSSRPSVTQNKGVLIAGGAVVVALLVFVFIAAPPKKPKADGGKTLVGHQVTPPSESSEKSVFPVVESTKPQVKTPEGGWVAEQDIAHTASSRPPQSKTFGASVPPQSGSLGSIPPFDANQANWQAPSYQPTTTTASVRAVSEPINERDRPSLVFIQKLKEPSSAKASEQEDLILRSGPSIGLPVGTRLRARLESSASTAVKAPVIAVVEYNYEKNGEIVVPAGTKALGRIEAADRTGYLSLRFDSLLMPDGTQTDVEAVATDLKLGPLRGKVEGKHTGKNLVVRSLSGIGEVGALVVGRSGSLNQPFSEGDMLREQVSSNIGQAADQSLLGLGLSEHIVVSVFANTPIYLILDRATKQTAVPQQTSRPASTAPTNSVESLRQLLQLQRELNQSVDAITRDQSQRN